MQVSQQISVIQLISSDKIAVPIKSLIVVDDSVGVVVDTVVMESFKSVKSVMSLVVHLGVKRANSLHSPILVLILLRVSG